jgi:hypothetical protein
MGAIWWSVNHLDTPDELGELDERGGRIPGALPEVGVAALRSVVPEDQEVAIRYDGEVRFIVGRTTDAPLRGAVHNRRRTSGDGDPIACDPDHALDIDRRWRAQACSELCTRRNERDDLTASRMGLRIIDALD